MLKNDRMMMILTGLVLAIFAGSMVKYGDRIMGLMSGTDIVVSQDDSFSVRAGSAQVLDVLSNDTVKGQIVVLSRPGCGAIELTGSNKISFSSDESCQGEVEFAYCVDSEGTCTPNAVKVNIISVSYAQNSTTPTPTTPARSSESNSVAPNNVPVRVVQDAPEFASFSVEMAPPALAAPSMSELISPSIAMASIRQSAGGLNQTENLDQNITTQNSSSVSQTATVAPSVFAAPEMGESSGVRLGAGEQVLASNVATPSSLQPSASADFVLTTVDRGPEALASLQSARLIPSPSESAPLSASPERTSFTPGNAPDVQTASAQPEENFSANPIGTGPIALVALNPTSSGNSSGESLNVILTEPGLQSFAATSPVALAPAAVNPLDDTPQVASTALPPLTSQGNDQADTAETIQQASLETPAEASTGAALDQNSGCGINLTVNAGQGAVIEADILAACKPYQMVTIQHAGLAFSLLTDAQGAAHTSLPALEASADVTVMFADGSQATSSLTIRDIDNVLRVGVSWSNGMNLDLQAIEFGAAAGSEGRVNAAAPRDYRTSRIKGGGYLTQLGDPTIADGKLAEVYTIPVAHDQQRGTIALSIILDNPATVCGQSILAKTVRSHEGQSPGIRSVRFTVPACGNLSSTMELPGAVNDLRLAGR